MLPFLMSAVSSISWLENNVFLFAHTPSTFDADVAPPTAFNLITRQPPNSYMFQKLPEVCSPFGLNRSPPFQFLQRLRDFPPSVQDVIIVASTASQDIGMFSRSKEPLTSDLLPEKITKVFTTTVMANDSRRAQMMMTEEMVDTSPIGVALDLSSKNKISRPLPAEEMDESPGPLPALMVLNNEGILASWWIVYAESIRKGTSYPGLTAIAEQQQMQPQQLYATALAQQAPALGQSAFGASSTNSFGSALAKPAAPAFGSTSTPGSIGGAFGTSSGLGNQPSSWAVTTSTPQTMGATFGKPAFGSFTPVASAPQGATFGATATLNRQSPWGSASPGASAAAGSVLGQSAGLGMNAKSVLGANTSSATFGSIPTSTTPMAGSGGGFASFANAGGFAAAAAQSSGESAISKSTPAASFGSGMDTDTSFGGTPTRSGQASGGIFGMEGGFTIGSTFKSNDSIQDDAPSPKDSSDPSLFGPTFGSALGDSQKTTSTPQTKEADMGSEGSRDDEEQSSQGTPIVRETTTPADTPAPSKFFSVPPISGGLFGTQAQSETTPAAVQNSTPAPSSFLKPDEPAPNIDETPKKPEQASQSPPDGKSSPIIKLEPDEEAPRGIDKSVPEAPLPSNPTSKASFTPGGSSSSSAMASKSAVDDAPLPPDFIASKPRPKTPQDLPDESLGLPTEQEDDGLDDEGSGVDVAQEISPMTDSNPSLKATPESSFGAPPDKSPLGGLFTNIGRQQAQQPSKTLFGEVGKTSAPVFPPPSKVQESPRSPSPVRLFIPENVLRPDNARSVSAPGLPSKALANRKAVLGRAPQMALSASLQPSAEDRRKEERDRILAQQAKMQAEEEQDLSDKEDEKIREELATEVAATMILDPFLAHQDYIGNISKPGIPGQIEKVYRDINSMIDTLGLNARSLESFMKGHSEMYKDGGRIREDLESDDEWCLIEIEDLILIEKILKDELDEGRLHDVQEKIDSCRELQRDLAKLRAKQNEIKHTMEVRFDPEHVEAARSAPLTAEQHSSQNELRSGFATLQKQLAQAEADITMLRAKLASNSHSSNRPGFKKTPTVDAVTKTIMKMTSMAEKKSGDIDVLENLMRKLGVDATKSINSSREASPFITPPTSSKMKSRSVIATTPAWSVNGDFHTPRSVFGGSVGSNAVSRRRISGVTADDIQRYGNKARRRKEINDLLKEALVKDGMRVRTLGET